MKPNRCRFATLAIASAIALGAAIAPQLAQARDHHDRRGHYGHEQTYKKHYADRHGRSYGHRQVRPGPRHNHWNRRAGRLPHRFGHGHGYGAYAPRYRYGYYAYPFVFIYRD